VEGQVAAHAGANGVVVRGTPNVAWTMPRATGRLGLRSQGCGSPRAHVVVRKLKRRYKVDSDCRSSGNKDTHLLCAGASPGNPCGLAAEGGF
jgi:hypothetical protein